MEYRINESLSINIIDDEIILQKTTSDVALLNSTASIIFKLIQNKYSFEQIVNYICDNYQNTSRDIIVKDVTDSIQKMIDLDLISMERSKYE